MRYVIVSLLFVCGLVWGLARLYLPLAQSLDRQQLLANYSNSMTQAAGSELPSAPQLPAGRTEALADSLILNGAIAETAFLSVLIVFPLFKVFSLAGNLSRL
jgi:hypothetical protein